ncbi:hypothetical protein H072_626 [Dactylellina haptotyla CBS 200.50]|uniref:Methyltransferase domain-containing protein n=1 Tax=Dactylellina haptotyla (strain CBS 200.50) TaxID=1284197 RepID=S8ARC1_DACHA|nr:hypothetical protein H072_626 [Dactylellina haptotyla CBS 200.50]
MGSTSVPLSVAPQIAAYSPLAGANSLKIETVQVKHRLNLINEWKISSNNRILELGCGQGTCTAPLAYAVGPTGHVDAVDPGPPDYGSPITLAQAQEFMSATEIGPRISWHRATPIEFLQGKPETTWDTAVLAHCIWYFESEDTLKELLEVLKGRVQKICIAECALKASNPLAIPHLLATIARGSLECCKTNSTENIRTLISPSGIKDIARSTGWDIEDETVLVPEDLFDGNWETGTVVSQEFSDEINRIENRRLQTVLKSSREATKLATEGIGGVKNVATMDVWCASLTLNAEST